MKPQTQNAGKALLAAAVLALGIPASVAAQVQMSGSQQTALLQSALAHLDRETQMLASMRNHIPSREVVPVAVSGLPIRSVDRRAMIRAMSQSRHAALGAALGKATVADQDRTNGQSEDQSSLAEYLQHLGIDPNKVVAVDIDSKLDRDNPRVTVFYRR